MRWLAALWLVLAMPGNGCSNGEVRMSGGSAGDHTKVALDFTNALATRDYRAAYALTSNEYRDSTSVEAMQAAFEAIVPNDWKTIGPVEVGGTMAKEAMDTPIRDMPTDCSMWQESHAYWEKLTQVRCATTGNLREFLRKSLNARWHGECM